VLDRLLRGLSGDWIRGTEGPGTWSPFDVVGHLIHGERTDWMPRLQRILGHGESRPFDPFDRVAMFRDSEGKTLDELLDLFTGLRRANLSELAGLKLAPADFGRRGTHPALGSVTLAQLIATWAVHDLDHLCQIGRVMAKQYAEATGPWRAYIGAISRPL
jgi:hypothetical protein